jgi:hypothetical protein
LALEQNYYELWFESFLIDKVSGHKSKVQLHLLKPQSIPEEIQSMCDSRGISPFELFTECSKKFFTDYPVGTKFLLKTKLTDREGKGPFLYSYYRWKPLEIKSNDT